MTPSSSSCAGDLRRAKAACERLVLVAGHAFPAERRDLGVILLHCGFVSQVCFFQPGCSEVFSRLGYSELLVGG